MNYRRILSRAALVIGVFLFSAGLQTFAAWTAPTIAPPGADAYAPLNTSLAGQIKEGNLQVNALGIQGTGNAFLVPNGNVGIGTVNPAQRLDVNGYVKGTGLCIGTDCKTAWPSGGGALIGGSCPSGQYVSGISSAGVPSCTPLPGSGSCGTQPNGSVWTTPCTSGVGTQQNTCTNGVTTISKACPLVAWSGTKWVAEGTNILCNAAWNDTAGNSGSVTYYGLVDQGQIKTRSLGCSIWSGCSDSGYVPGESNVALPVNFGSEYGRSASTGIINNGIRGSISVDSDSLPVSGGSCTASW